MMTEIALNILDVAENSISAGASLIHIEVIIDEQSDTLIVLIKDNGRGMDEEQLKKAADPFYTTRTTRKVGLGIPFFKQAAEGTGGSFEITSRKNAGTTIKAVFGLSHIDRMPLGDINTTIYTLVTFNERIDFYYRYAYDEREFVLDTREVKEILGGMSFRDAEVSRFIREYLDANKTEADGGKEV